MLTLSEAAKETGLTRSGIFKAIKSGKISATKDDNGHFQIDPAELFRVYSRINAGNVASEQRETAEERQETGENKVLHAKIDVMGKLLRQVESERDDLRRRLDDEATERRKLTALLTHQREPEGLPAIVAPIREPREQPPSVWGWFLGGAVLVAGMVAVYVWLAPALLPQP
jgi:hypothetical protein